MSEAPYSLVLDFGGRTEVIERVDVVLSEVLDFFDLSPSSRSVSVAITPREIDWPAAVADGWDPSDATARIYQSGRVVLAGTCSGPARWSERGGTVRLTITEDPWIDSTTIPTSWDQRTTIANDAALDLLAQPFSVKPDVPGFSQGTARWDPVDLRGNPDTPAVVARQGLSLTTDSVVGRWGPWVFGAPGYQDGESWPATPAYWVDTTDGEELLLVARHRVAASQVTIYGTCNDGEVRPKVLDVVHVRDAFGVEVAAVELGPVLTPDDSVITITITHAPSYTYLGTLIDTRRRGRQTRTSTTISGGADLAAATAAWVTAMTQLLADPFGVAPRAAVASPVSGTITLTPARGVQIVPIAVEAIGGGSATYTIGETGALPTDFAIDLTGDWYAAWTHGEALPGGAGDVIRLILGQTRARVDYAGLLAERGRLNRYRLAGYIDAPTGAIEWLVAQLAALPIGWIVGVDGLRAWVYDPDAVPLHELTDAREGGHLEVAGDAGETSRAPVSTVSLSYRHRDDTLIRQRVTAPRSLYRLEASRAGEELSIASDVIDDEATAELAAQLRLRALHRRHLTIVGHVTRRDIRAGDRVRVDVPRLGVRGVGWVVLVEDDGGDRLLVECAVEQGGASSPPAASEPCYTHVPPPPPFDPSDIGWDLWYDAADPDARTLGGDGYTGLANKGSFAGADVGVPNASGIADTAWQYGATAIDLPGPVAVATPFRSFVSSELTSPSIAWGLDYTIWAIVPATPSPYSAANSDAYFALLGAAVQKELTLRKSADGGMQLTSGTSGWGGSLPTVLLAEVAPGALNAGTAVLGDYLVLVFRSSTTRLKASAWYVNGGGTPTKADDVDIAQPMLVPEGIVRVGVCGRNNVANGWRGLFHSVAFVRRTITDDEVADLAEWSAALLGWPGVPT